MLEAQLAYWRDALSGAPLTLDLPTDRPRPPVRSPRGASEERRLPAELAAPRSAGPRPGATAFMTLLAAFGALMHRYTGAPDVLVGTPVAGRSRAETEPLIGFFVNTLVMRDGLRRRPDLRPPARADPGDGARGLRPPGPPLRAAGRGALPGARPLPDPHRPGLLRGREPLAGGGELAPGLALAGEDVELGIAKFDLFLGLVPGPDGAPWALEYATDLFDAATVQRMLGHLEVLLAAAVADPGGRVSELPLLAEAERAQLCGWNDEARARTAPGTSLHGLFEAQAARTPGGDRRSSRATSG